MLCSLACSPSFSISLSSSKAKKTHLFCAFFGRKERGAETRKPIEEERRRKRANAKTENSTITPRHCCSLFSLRAHLSRETEREEEEQGARCLALAALLSSLFLRSFRRATRVHPAADGQREREREQRRERKKRIPFPIVGARRSPHRSGENSLSVFSQPWPPLSRSSRTTCASTRSTSCE